QRTGAKAPGPRRSSQPTDHLTGPALSWKGELKGAITVRCANETATVPVHAVVQRPARGGSRVLVVEGPFEASATQDPSLLDAWRRLVDDGRLDVDYLVPDRSSPVVDVAALARADTVLIAQRGLVKLQ